MSEAEYLELISKNPKAAASLFISKDREILKLQNNLYNALHAQYGRKSEKLLAPGVEQISLFPVDELNKAEPEEEPKELEVAAHTRTKKRTRREIPEGTPVVRIEHAAKETHCKCCGKELCEIRKETTRILNYVPAHFEVEEHIRPVLVCKSCDSAPVTEALKPGIQLIERSPAGAGLLSHILISKYQDHLPLNRLETIFARHGFEVPRQRMCDWLAHLAELLHPLYKVIKSELLKQEYLQADETTVKVRDDELNGSCHTGYFWAILAPPPVNLVYFHYAASRASEVPKILLGDFKGILQTDLYAGYNEVYLAELSVRAGCFAHVRRKFLDIQKLSPASEWNRTLKLISELYKIEKKDIQDLKLLHQQRGKYSKPILEELKEHLTRWEAKTLPESPVCKAIKYALKQWEALELFIKDPRVKLDNNLIENQMRPIALGRKNWLFAGSHDGAMRASIFFSLINSCRLHKLNTWTYFNDVLKRLPATPQAELVNLLPHRWSQIS